MRSRKLYLRSSLRQLLKLLSKTELLYDRTVALDVGLLKVTEKVSSVTNHLLQAATAVMVLVIALKVLGEVLDSVGKKCYLYLGRTCVTLVGCVLLNNCLLFVFQHFWYSPFKNIFIKKHSNRWVNVAKATFVRKPSIRYKQYYITFIYICKEFFGILFVNLYLL